MVTKTNGLIFPKRRLKIDFNFFRLLFYVLSWLSSFRQSLSNFAHYK